MAETTQVPPDPIRSRSLSGPIAVSTALLILTTAWAVWDEGVHKRPYLDYQDQWIDRLGAHIERLEPDVAAREAEVMNDPEIVALGQQATAVELAGAPAVNAVREKLNAIAPRLAAMDFQFRDRKGQSDQYINRIENAHDEEDKERLRKKLADYRAETFEIEFPDGTKQQYTAPALIAEFTGLKTEEGRLQAELGVLSAPTQVVERERNDLIAKKMRGDSTAKLASLKNELTGFRKEIKQIHVPEMRDLVDRCESCHLGVQSPIPLTAADMGGDRVFASHPNSALLKIHPPDKFGCSPCHGGNGVAVINADTAHGHYKHWLWPMPAPENIEAGCVQCHTADLVIDHAPVLNQGRETFRIRGCWGCHRYDGFETEADALVQVQKSMRDLRVDEAEVRTREADVQELRTALSAGAFSAMKPRMQSLARDIVDNSASFDAAKRDELRAAMTAGALSDDQNVALGSAAYLEVPAADQKIAAIETSRATLARSENEALLEMKKIGPSLKEVRMKIKPAWLPYWIADPSKFRPTTKMPTYAQLMTSPKQVEAISAFIWARGVEGPLATHQPGDPKRGEKLVRDRGCVACHSAKIGDEVIGGAFAAELTRVGEKDNFDYLVRWVSDPKQKTLPYSYGLKRDLKPEDFTKANVPFEFNHPNPAWPKEWGTLLTHQMTVMPNLRLSNDDARDIASWLTTQTGEGGVYGDASTVTSASAETLAYGEKLVKHYGCAGCHEIAGLEDEQKIGVELTKEGSKPIERLDFGHLTHEAKLSGHKGGWYNQKGFIDRKLENPQIWDQGKELANEFAALRMPNFRFKKDEITAVSTMLIGSVESGIPPAFMHLPQDQRKAVQEGWWIVKKYNCVGCHAIRPGELPVLWTTKWFTTEGADMTKWTDANGEEHKGGSDRRPPTLVGEGARVDPQWVSEFLRNPALSTTNVHRNGLRPYLNVRMPTYDLSQNEIGKLVRFFNALSNQPLPYVRPEQEPLTTEEAAAGRAILASACAKCHATADATTFKPDVNAPGFFHAQARLRPDWNRRLIQTPSKMLPGTNMPAWFHVEGDRWVFNDKLPEGTAASGDHVDLMVRFLAQFNNPGVGTAPPK